MLILLVLKSLIVHLVIFMQIFLLLYVFAIRIDKKTLYDIGIVRNNGAKVFFYGIFFSVAGMLISWSIYVFSNDISYTLKEDIFTNFYIILPWIVVTLLQVSYEELLFRNWLLISIRELSNEKVAIFIGGLFFGITHLLNPGFSLLGIVNGVIVGITLSFVYFKTGSIWMPIGLHFGWNFTREILTNGVFFSNMSSKVEVIPRISELESTIGTLISVVIMGTTIVWMVNKYLVKQIKDNIYN